MNLEQDKPSFVFFFFQAEDGIRDADVTGVQTCALPISLKEAGIEYRPERVFFGDFEESSGQERSEERRVGKSVDLGGRRIIKKKKTNNSIHERTIGRVI